MIYKIMTESGDTIEAWQNDKKVWVEISDGGTASLELDVENLFSLIGALHILKAKIEKDGRG